MKIQIDHYTPVPTVAVIGCEQSFGCEQLEIDFGREWKKLKKYVTLYPSEDESDAITIEYKRTSIEIPAKVYEKAGVCRYVIRGESDKKKLVCKTGYLSVLKAPEELHPTEDAATLKRKGASV